ncbi:helix-turn-helix domain containing protein [Romboutsia maritimum]|uniref:helix-turn-helix domain containing protein n=1 Tax=Romboutsia maritimum TaxID=2020948 RepID=UPI001FB10999|nr:helix-turn-helix domain containing protein [Romboutsia maritimum]
MSKLNLNIDNVKIGEIGNKVIELNNYIVVVEKKYIHELEKNNIPFKQFTSEDYYLVKRGKKKKRFNKEQQQEILLDLQSGLSIKKCSIKYKCSTRTIQDIKKEIY